MPKIQFGRVNCVRLLPVVGMLFNVTGIASAQTSQVFRPYMQFSTAYDSNLLRLPDAEVPVSDNFRRAVGGVTLEKSFGLQHFRFNLQMDHTAFNQLSDLDFDGKEFQARWRWQAARNFEANFGADYLRELASYLDFHERQLNLRTIQRSYVDATWRIHSAWQGNARLSHEKFTYDLTTQQNNNRDENVLEVGAAYVARSTSRVGLVARWRQSRELPAQSEVSRFRQHELGTTLDWRASSKSRFELVFTRIDRDDEGMPSRSFSGLNSRITATWVPTAALSTHWSAWHERQPRESQPEGFALSRGSSMAGAWKLSTKLTIEVIRKQEHLHFPGSTSEGISEIPSDWLRNASAAMTFQPMENLHFRATLFRESRNSDETNRSFAAHGIAIQSRLEF